MIIVGLTGKAGSGKDTVADRLVERHGFKKLSFAGPLKAVLLTVNPILGIDVFQPGYTVTLSEAMEKFGGEAGVKRLYPSYRRYLQKLGTEGIRAIDPEFWVKAAVAEVNKLPRDARVVFTDCRFPNEAAAIKYHFRDYDTTELWQVERQEELRDNGSISPHVSEEHVGNMGESVTIWNNSTFDDLRWTVDSLARDLIEVETVKLAA